MAEAAAAADEDPTVVKPLPMGLVEVALTLIPGTITESKWDDGDEDDATNGWSNGEGVMLVRAGGCPIGVMDRPEPVPTGAILQLLLVVGIVLLTEEVGATVGGMKLEVDLVGAWIWAGSCCDGIAAVTGVAATTIWLVDDGAAVEDKMEVVLAMLVIALPLLLVLVGIDDEVPNGAGSPLAGDC